LLAVGEDDFRHAAPAVGVGITVPVEGSIQPLRSGEPFLPLLQSKGLPLMLALTPL
jgi:hypothetical protein